MPVARPDEELALAVVRAVQPPLAGLDHAGAAGREHVRVHGQQRFEDLRVHIVDLQVRLLRTRQAHVRHHRRQAAAGARAEAAVDVAAAVALAVEGRLRDGPHVHVGGVAADRAVRVQIRPCRRTEAVGQRGDAEFVLERPGEAVDRLPPRHSVLGARVVPGDAGICRIDPLLGLENHLVHRVVFLDADIPMRANMTGRPITGPSRIHHRSTAGPPPAHHRSAGRSVLSDTCAFLGSTGESGRGRPDRSPDGRSTSGCRKAVSRHSPRMPGRILSNTRPVTL